MTGGAVVDRTGGLVAMASNTDLEGLNFALAETDLADAVDALLDGSAPAEATDWNPAPLVQGPTSHTVTIDGPSDIHAFTISGDAWAEEMVIEVSDPRARVMLMENGFYALSLNDPAKEAAQANEPWWSLGMEVETFADLAPEDPLRLHVRDDQRGQDRVVLVGAAEPIDDLRIETEPGSVEVDILPEIGSIEVGEEVVGATGFLDAFEAYAVDLEVGKPVVIDVETATGRPALLVVHAGRAWNETANEELRTSTEEGTGMLSRDVREVFEPFTSGRHLIIVTTYDETASSYRLRVSPA